MQLRRTPRLIWLILLLLVMGNGQAGLIGTEQVLKQQQIHNAKLKIQTALARNDVKQILLEHGVSPQQIQARIDQLTNQEIHQLANQFDELPAAAGPAVILLMTGPVMLLLEFMGMTDLTTAF